MKKTMSKSWSSQGKPAAYTPAKPPMVTPPTAMTPPAPPAKSSQKATPAAGQKKGKKGY